MSLDRFFPIGSPLDRKVVPLDWKRLSLRGKRLALVKAGIARDLEHAARLMAQHGAAVRRFRNASGKRKSETER